jgi:hypothetical protein
VQFFFLFKQGSGGFVLLFIVSLSVTN